MDSLKHLLINGFLLLTAYLPLAVGRFLGRCLGLGSYCLQSTTAKITAENIGLCFPTLSRKEQKALTLKSLRHTGMTLFEMGPVWLRNAAWVNRKTLDVEGADILQRALDNDKGVIVLGPHHGNWEALGVYLSEQAPIAILYQPPENKKLEQIIRQSREQFGATLLPTNARGLASLFKILKNGGYTGILPDQTPEPSGGDFAPFFGVPALTMSLVHNLVQRTGCQVVMAYSKRVPGGFNVIIKPARDGIGADDLAHSLTQLNASVEDCVNDCPEQYQWEYKRFRKRQVGEPKRYDF